jgi:hypothetical protein
LLNGFHLSHLLLLDVRADPGKPGQERSSGGGAGWVCGDGRVPRGVEVAPEPEAVRTSPLGEIDMATVDGVRERLDELRATGVRRLLLALRLLAWRRNGLPGRFGIPWTGGTLSMQESHPRPPIFLLLACVRSLRKVKGGPT